MLGSGRAAFWPNSGSPGCNPARIHIDSNRIKYFPRLGGLELEICLIPQLSSISLVITSVNIC